jgi:hypothetical protein
MEAGEVGPSYTLDNRLEVSHAADTVTGSKPVDATPGSDSSPRSKARRHLNTRFSFTPCALATSATLAPGTNVSSTIRRFSATDRHLNTTFRPQFLCLNHDTSLWRNIDLAPEGNFGRLLTK